MFQQKLTIATHNYDQVQALKSGEVTVEGVGVTFKTAPVVTEIFEAMLGSGLIAHSQNRTVAASAMAEKKTVGHRL